MKIDNNIIMFI